MDSIHNFKPGEPPLIVAVIIYDNYILYKSVEKRFYKLDKEQYKILKETNCVGIWKSKYF